MQFIWGHIEAIIDSYKGAIPLTHFLKAYYRKHPKLGSRDRKMLSEMVYSWYRCSKAVDAALPFQQRLATCIKACHTENKHLLRLIQDIPTEPLNDLEGLLPETLELSEGIERDGYLKSMLVQPLLFIRLRAEKEKVEAVLQDEGVAYEYISDDCIALPNGTPIDKWIPEYVYVVQDASSQAVGQYFNPLAYQHWWDVCAGAGGKALLLKDLEPLADITVTDKRKAILNNLKDRFRTYSHILNKAQVLNVTDKQKLDYTFDGKAFDNIICDAPCTGSGTWARTPEQLYFFNPDELTRFTDLQKNIAINAAAFLKSGGKMFYVTCSVFKNENENVVKEVVEQTGLKLVEQHLINGMDKKADSMFVAILEKS